MSSSMPALPYQLIKTPAWAERSLHFSASIEGWERTVLPSARLLTGRLPYDRRLKRPIVIFVEEDDYEVIVSEPEFHIHAGGPTEQAALDAFKHVLSGYIDVLSSREESLGDMVQAQLAYLRSIIVSA